MGARAALTLALVALAPAGAQAADSFDVYVNPTGTRGYVRLRVIAQSGVAGARVFERVHGRLRPLGPVALDGAEAPAPGLVSGRVPRAVAWRCDRLVRTLVVRATAPDGDVESEAASGRTPSCASRLALGAPRVARPGRPVRVTVRDRFGLGGVRARLCRPGGCRALRIPRGATVARRTLRFPRGRARVVVRTRYERLGQVISVGVAPRPQDVSAAPRVLATGDSLMENLKVVLADRLGRRARVTAETYASSGLSKTTPVDWPRRARRQVAALRPDATVMFLGTSDGYPMTTPDGETVTCCDEPYVAEYARRARRIMRIYGRVLWINIPAAREARRNPIVAAVDTALARAAADVDGAEIVDLFARFTPGGEYRDRLRPGGPRVRAADGIHLTPAGASIAARIVVRALRRNGLL